MALYSNNPRDAGRIIRGYATAIPPVDAELRGFMLRVFNTMAGGLALTGIVAWLGQTAAVGIALVVGRSGGWRWE
jgi:FtsH-binding integral membrane protein